MFLELAWDFVVELLCQAYLAISLDTTGLFRFLAFWVVRKGGSSGRRLYLYLYAFFFVAGILVGNVSDTSGYS